MSANDLIIFMKIHTYLEAWATELILTRPNVKARVERLLENLEISMVNAKPRPNLEVAKIKVKITPQVSQEILIEQAIDKKTRNEYKDDLRTFYYYIMKPCYNLKNFAVHKRKDTLKKYLQKINIWLYNRRETRDGDTKLSRKLRCGILMPFTKNPESNLIVRIAHEELLCFSTKERSPYMFVVETIDPRELEERQPELKKDPDFEKMLYTKTDAELELATKIPAKKVPAIDLKPIEAKEQPEKVKTVNSQTDVGGNNCLEVPKEPATHKKQKSTALIKENPIDQAQTPPLELMKSPSKLEPPTTPIKTEPKQSKRRNSCITLGNSTKATKLFQNNEQWITSSIKFYSEFILPNLLKIKNESLRTILWNYYEDLHSRKNTLSKKTLKKSSKLNPTRSPNSSPLTNWGGTWPSKSQIITTNSPHANFLSLKIRPFVLKAADDMRQEMLALQLISLFKKIFDAENTGIKIISYEMHLTSAESGWIDFLPDTISIDSLKKKHKGETLVNIYQKIFADRFEEAQKNFVESLSGGALISYILSLRDRHNGNLLIDNKGHIINIDFGFMLGSSPGNINMESVPFKFTEEYMELIGGVKSDMFIYFKILFVRGLGVLRKFVDTFCDIVRIYKDSSGLPCFLNFDIGEFRKRFGLGLTDREREEIVENLIWSSFGSKWTWVYDEFQKYTNNIEP
jgi:hypothetical protein